MLATSTLAALATATLLATGYTAVCGTLAWRFTAARRQRPSAGPAGAQSVRFAARDRRARIDGWYLGGAAPQPAVVFVHGKDACRGDELKAGTGALVAALAARGMAVLMIDLRGHGTSSAARLTYGARERYDVLGAVDWLRARGHTRIGVLGASMGAASALMAAADEPAIAALVADSPFADFGRLIERHYRRLARLPGIFLPGALALARLLTGENLLQVRPIAGARTLAGRPVLVIHSEGDRFIPPEDGRAIARASGAELWTTATDGHIGSFRAAPAVYTERVLDFFGRHLQAA